MIVALLKLYWLALQISLLSFGGIYSFWALLDREAVRECATGAPAEGGEFSVCRDDFNTVFIISKIVPGPHVNTASVLGYPRYGFAGMLVLLLGLLTPGLLVVPLVFLFYHKYGRSRAVKRFFQGAGIASISLLVVFLTGILAGQATGGAGRMLGAGCLFAASFWLSYRRKLNPMLAVLGGGIFGFYFLQ